MGPGVTEVSLRAATLPELRSLTEQSFPTFSLAAFAVETRNESGPVALCDPVNIQIMFTETEEGIPNPFTDGAADEHSPALSPDGRWLAYASDGDIWVAAFPDKRDRVQVSVDGGAEPRWAKGGNELYFRAGDSLYVAQLQVTPRLDVGRRAALFSVEGYAPGLRAANYDVSADGERFVFAKQVGNRPQYVVVERNWVRKLRDLVGPR